MYLTMVVSMTHRVTGLALGLGTLWLTWWLIAAAAGPDQFAQVQEFSGSWLGRLLLLGFTYGLMLHLLNGIRHLFWDAGWGFDLDVVEITAWAVVGGAAVLTLIVWIAGYYYAGALG